MESQACARRSTSSNHHAVPGCSISTRARAAFPPREIQHPRRGQIIVGAVNVHEVGARSSHPQAGLRVCYVVRREAGFVERGHKCAADNGAQKIVSSRVSIGHEKLSLLRAPAIHIRSPTAKSRSVGGAADCHGRVGQLDIPRRSADLAWSIDVCPHEHPVFQSRIAVRLADLSISLTHPRTPVLYSPRSASFSRLPPANPVQTDGARRRTRGHKAQD